ncbi:MAG: ROK family protein [Actinobacteria bacterium]|nr:MAG: ROK family protein [Actinomycetota bacterium]
MSERLIGVDVGGTKVSVAALRDGELTEPTLHPTEHAGADQLIEQLTVAVQDALRTHGGDAVGIGIPSVIEFSTGRVRSSVNVPLQDVALRSVMQERVDVPVLVDNDATCAALAEAHGGGAELEVANLVMLTLGTGVGGGIVIGGRIYRGSTGAAGELGHTLIGAALQDGAPAHAEHFPQPGSLERLAAGRALDELAESSATQHPESALGRLRAQGKPVAGPDCVSAAQAGDEHACAALATLGGRLGVGIANVINTFDPDVVAIGGGVSAAGELLLDPARKAAARFVLPGVGARTEIRLARSGPKAGVLGAALLAREELAGVRHPLAAGELAG